MYQEPVDLFFSVKGQDPIKQTPEELDHPAVIDNKSRMGPRQTRTYYPARNLEIPAANTFDIWPPEADIHKGLSVTIKRVKLLKGFSRNHFYSSVSIFFILATRMAWRSTPSNSAFRKAITSSLASCVPITRPPKQSTFIWSCSTP